MNWAISWAVATGIGIFLVEAWAISTVFATIFPPSYDATDPPGGGRSGLSILTDCETGLQYLTASSGGLTPRLDEAGKQMRIKCDEEAAQ